jgi:hypothetical protein
MNRRSAVIDANDYKAQTVYDLAGHPVKTINPLGNTNMMRSVYSK